MESFNICYKSLLTLQKDIAFLLKLLFINSENIHGTPRRLKNTTFYITNCTACILLGLIPKLWEYIKIS
jgi:hypothetical protein